MSEIHVARGSEKLGSFPVEEVIQGLQTGRFLPTDLGWRTGMDNWKPLAEIPELNADGVPSAPQEPLERNLPAWEQRDQLGFFPALLETVKTVLLQPVDTFARMRRSGDWMGPGLYALLLGTVGFWISTVFDFMFQAMGIGGEELQFMATMGAAALVGILIIMPFMVVLGLLISTLIFHLCLMLVGGANQPMETTFRVVAYSMGSTATLHIVPICGSFIGSIWNLVLLVIGFSKAHDIGIGRAIAAVLLPLVLCCGLIVVFAVAAGAFGAAAAGGG